jgi:hypothetical protein
VDFYKTELNGNALRDEVNRRLGENFPTQYVLEVRRGAKGSKRIMDCINEILAEVEAKAKSE